MSLKKILYLFIFIGLLGFLDATYLTIKHYQGVVPPCAIVRGCETVTTSKYSTVFNLPVALLGALYYLSMVLSTILYLDIQHRELLVWITRGTSLGLVASLWFLFLQLFVLHAWCLYCLISITTSTLLFGLGHVIRKRLLPQLG